MWHEYPGIEYWVYLSYVLRPVMVMLITADSSD